MSLTATPTRLSANFSTRTTSARYSAFMGSSANVNGNVMNKRISLVVLRSIRMEVDSMPGHVHAHREFFKVFIVWFRWAYPQHLRQFGSAADALFQLRGFTIWHWSHHRGRAAKGQPDVAFPLLMHGGQLPYPAPVTQSLSNSGLLKPSETIYKLEALCLGSE